MSRSLVERYQEENARITSAQPGDPGLHVTSEPAGYRVVVELHPS